MKQLAQTLALLIFTITSPLIAGGLSDSFGYTAVQTGDPDAIPFAFTDISTTAPPLTVSDDDDGGVLIDLPTPFPFYGSFYSQVVMSTNGYLSFDSTDSGNDANNDNPLPVTPNVGGGARIYPLHDDLLADAPASLHYQYFPEGLRDFPLLPKIGVHVFQWNEVRHFLFSGTSDRFSFQTLLFDDGTIHFVYSSGNPERGSESTTGIQNADAAIGLQIAANTANSIPDNSTATIFPPQLTVTSNADSGPGSLRQAIAAAPNPARITFASILDGETMNLSQAFVNELHYDNTGTDEGEFIEVVVGPGLIDRLNEISLELYNGSTGDSYRTIPLASFDNFDNPEVSNGYRIFTTLSSGIQNGPADGWALVVEGQVVEFLSYEGSFMGNYGSAAGMTTTDIGVAQDFENPVGTDSLGLSGMGTQREDFVWGEFTGLPFTPGALNPGQVLGLETLAPPCLLYTSPSPRDLSTARMPSSA